MAEGRINGAGSGHVASNGASAAGGYSHSSSRTDSRLFAQDSESDEEYGASPEPCTYGGHSYNHGGDAPLISEDFNVAHRHAETMAQWTKSKLDESLRPIPEEEPERTTKSVW